MREDATRYDTVAVVLHWVIGVARALVQDGRWVGASLSHHGS